MIAARGVSRAVFAFLRGRPNEKFTAGDIAGELRVGASTVSAILCSGYAMFRSGLQREQVEGQRSYLYWMSDAGEFGGADPRAYAVARWMLRHGRSAIPSAVAKGTGVPVDIVAKLLELWASKGSVVRCELVLREGYDRFEYRMATSAAPFYGDVRPTVRAADEVRASIREAA